MRDQKSYDDSEKSSDRGINDEDTNHGTNEDEVDHKAPGTDNSNDQGTGQERTPEEDKGEECCLLVQYNLKGDKLFEEMFDDYADYMTEVTLGNKICLALSYRWV